MDSKPLRGKMLSPERGQEKRGKKGRTVVTDQKLKTWITAHDGGMTFPQIANYFKADHRTVEKHLPPALEKRRWREIREGVDRDELQGHLKQIREAARGIRASLELPLYQTASLWIWPTDPEEPPLQEILRSHFPASPAWVLLEEWETGWKNYLAARTRLNERIQREVEARSWSNDVAIGLLHQALPRAWGEKPPETAAYPLKGVPWKAFLDEIMEWEEINEVAHCRSELQKLRDELKEGLTVIVFAVRIPGECRFCSL